MHLRVRTCDFKDNQPITGGIFYCRDSAGFSVSVFNKLTCNLTGKCFEIGNKNILPNRYRQVLKTTRSAKAKGLTTPSDRLNISGDQKPFSKRGDIEKPYE